jgi:sodium-dependent dicarboxylate transporter 2/3/5
MENSDRPITLFRLLALVGGPLLATICWWLLPLQYQHADGELVPFSPAGRATMLMLMWMAVWWLTEAISIYATALLPLVCFPLLGVAPMDAAAGPYANPLIFLFMGGFLLALSMERWGLGKRIALLVLSAVGADPIRIVAGFMFTTALLSAFVSNTATVAMMLPIALSVVGLVQAGDAATSNLRTCLMLGVAYAGSIGGVTTIIGTPPNVFLVSFLQTGIAQPYRMELSFVRYLVIGVPFTVVLLPIVLLLLTKLLYPIPSTKRSAATDLPLTDNLRPEEPLRMEPFIARELRGLGRINRGEWATFLVFSLTATAWICRPWLPIAGLTDPGIAMTGALLLFLIPVDLRQRVFVMDWETATKLPWGILVLFGGGLSLAAAVTNNGVAEFIASYSTALASLPPVVIILLITTAVVFLTELTSNLATTATLVPILAAIAPGLGIHPYLLVFPAALAASCAFMLPVATPPNAIVFGSGMVTIPQMIKAGWWLNIISILWITLLTKLVIEPLIL